MNRVNRYSREDLLERHRNLFNKFRSVPYQGIGIKREGTPIVIHRNVFWPCEDSLPVMICLGDLKGYSVLDLGTGTGVLALEAVRRGAEKVVAIDWNPSAVANAELNAKINGMKSRIEVRESDMFMGLDSDERFDLICANLPFMNMEAADVVESSIWDSQLHANRELVMKARLHIKEGGRILFAQSDFGDMDEVISMAEKNGYEVLEKARLIKGNDDIFFAYELIDRQPE